MWGVAGGITLFLLYASTLAPGATLWDSGELLAAVHSLGVPHPPGTPLFIVLVNVWTKAVGFLPFATASNLGSAVAAAVSCALLGVLGARWIGRPFVALPLAIAAGAMSSVWSSATETEVYSYTLLFNVLLLVVGDQVGRGEPGSRSRLLAFLFGLGVSLHLSALVAGPAAIVLAGRGAFTHGEAAALKRRHVVALGGAWIMALGVGLTSPVLLVAGLVVMLAPGFSPGQQGRKVFNPELLRFPLLVLLGCSALLIMMGLAQHDPAINQGNPDTWARLAAVVSREQYDVAGLWPRRAPFWLQIGNVIQYFDWQVGAGQATNPGAIWWRTPFTLAVAALAVSGAGWHRRTDRVSWVATVVAVASASLGAIVILNLRAGPSFGYGLLPQDVLHEARERDYFFLLHFVLAAAWATMGAVRFAERLSLRRVGLWVCAFALTPVVMGASRLNRRAEPQASLARLVGETLLMNAPAGSLLFLAGDNDTYPVWFVQQVKGMRPDVVPVTITLLGASWYRAELARRHGVLATTADGAWRGTGEAMRALVRSGRPVVMSFAVAPRDRDAVGAGWSFDGALFHFDAVGTVRLALRDTMAVALAALLDPQLGDRSPADPTEAYVWRLLHCPSAVKARAGGTDSTYGGLLESTCNYR